MTTVAYIANSFPSPLEPYVMDEISELRRRGARVICCSGKNVSKKELTAAELAFREDALTFHPLPPIQLARAIRRFYGNRKLLTLNSPAPFGRRLHLLAHTLLGAAMANELARSGVRHIHAHHGYFAAWMALVAARLLDISFSLTLHGSDLLLGKADFLDIKLEQCGFCATVSDFNRDFILRRFPWIPASKIIVQRLGVDPVASPIHEPLRQQASPVSILSVGRLHPVKNYGFLIEACAAMRDQELAFECTIAGEGPERRALERKILSLRLQPQVRLVGHVQRAELGGYYRRADLFVLTSRSEGLPVTLMEAMAHGCLVLAPAITGIPELVQHGRTGFLYSPGSMADFLSAVHWIAGRRNSLAEVQQAAVNYISRHYDRQKNVRYFADTLLSRIGERNEQHARSLLQ